MPAQTPYFDAFARLYDRYIGYIGASREPVLPWLRAVLPDRVGRAVDLDAGTGRYTTSLADRIDEVLAVDISAQVLDIARAEWHHPNVSYQYRSLLEVIPRARRPVRPGHVGEHHPSST